MARKFITQKEIDLINRVNKELIQNWVGQEVIYYQISRELSQVDDLYNESVEKTWYSPVRVNARVRYEQSATQSTNLSLDSQYRLEVYFHSQELLERNLVPREGDFLEFGGVVFEISSVTRPQLVFGQANNKIMVRCTCVVSREGQFQINNSSEKNVDNTNPIENSVRPPK